MEPESVLIYRIGSLGDTLVSLPALWAVRNHFRSARLTMLCDHHPGKTYVLAPDLLRGCGVVDEFMLYPVDGSRKGKLLLPLRMARLAAQLRLRRFAALVYLPPTRRPSTSIERDVRFFRWAGIDRQYGTTGFRPDDSFGTPGSMPLGPQEADLLLERLSLSGIQVPAPGCGRMDLNLNSQDLQEFETWRSTLPGDGGRRWISVGPGGKQPVNFWPVQRYRELVGRLIDEFDVWPVIFGGKEDLTKARELTAAWGRGYIAAGAVGLRASAAAMRQCAFHVGNDTGTLHLAAAAPVRCVGIFSAHDRPGEWYPYGPGHIVIRKQIDCERCMLKECIERRMECIMRIGVDEVYEACVAQLQADPLLEPSKA